MCLGIILIALFPITKAYSLEIPIILVASSALYLLLRKRLATGAKPVSYRLAKQIRALSHIIFIISLSSSMWLLWSNLYYRSPIYFILLLVAAASIILNIFSLDEMRKAHIPVVLLKIILLSLTVYIGVYYQFPGIYGVDPWLHTMLIQETVGLGHVFESQLIAGDIFYSDYFLFPIYHLSGATTHISTNLSIHDSIFVITGIVMVVCSLFAFLIGRKLANVRIGLLAALVLPLTADFIDRATAIIPMSLGLCFFLAILYISLCRDKKSAPDILLLIVLSVALILTHTVAAFVMLVVLIAIFLGIEFFKRGKPIGNNPSQPLNLDKHGKLPSFPHNPVSLTFIAFFGVAMLIGWTQSSPAVPSFFDWNLRELVTALQVDAQSGSIGPLIETNITNVASILDAGGFLILLALAIIGALISLHPMKRSAKSTALIFTAAALFIIPTSFQFFSLQNILPWRWFVFLYAPMSILAIQALLGLSSVIKRSIGKISFVMLILLPILFLMITNSTANKDSPLLFNGAKRFGYTQAEITAISTLSYMGSGRPVTDLYYGTIFPYLIGYDNYADMVRRDNMVFIYRNYFLHNPDWNQWYVIPIHLGGRGNYRSEPVLISDYIKEKAIIENPLIYSNGNVEAYAIMSIE